MTPTTMQAVVVRAPMEFGVEEVPLPQVDPGGLLLQVEACGLCGSDLRTLRGGHRKVTFPWIIGHEICGTVVETGTDYRGPWQPGQQLAVGPIVYCGTCDFCQDGRYELCENYREIAQAWPGGLADYIALPPESIRLGNVRAVSAGVDPAFAAITEPISSCLSAQEKGQVGLGDTVMVIGSGPVGCIHIALARARGASKIFIADIVDERLRLAEAFEPDATINVSERDLVEEVRRLTGGKGADVTVTATPAPVAQVQAVELTRKGGRILLFGGLPKDRSKPGVDMNIVHYNALHLIGTTIFAPRHHRLAVQLVESGRFPMDKLVTHRFPLSEFNAGATMALEGKVLKAVFLPGVG
ncbi:MAG: alcohol dehydrogenase catalytic domain-containing protein [Chloroflexota bacterium]|nr:alcohol dehydrogenase catalytic domain-containing protein [Chloroflexota bacterium]